MSQECRYLFEIKLIPAVENIRWDLFVCLFVDVINYSGGIQFTITDSLYIYRLSHSL